jgi:hypothetical protein
MLFIIIQVFKTFNDSRSSRIEAAKNSFNKLLDDIAIAVEFEPFIEKDTFIIKPVVGACKSGFLKFSVENGNPDIFIQKIRDHISNSVFTSWIVQPYIPQFTKSEYKVFIGGRDKCVVYQPVYNNNSVVMVYCPKNKIYSDIFGSDSCSLSSDYNTAMMCDTTGRHLVMMPHIERSTFPWNWAYYPTDRKDDVSPWIEAFVNARKWINNE